MNALETLRKSLQELNEYVAAEGANGSTATYIDTKSLSVDIANLVLTDLQSYEIPLASSILFNHEYGILRFLLTTLLRKQHSDAKKTLLEFLARYVERVKTAIKPYALEIKSTCVTMFSSDASTPVKNASFEPILALLIECTTSLDPIQLDIKGLYEKYFKDYATMQAKLSSSVKSSILQLLSTISRYYPTFIPHDRSPQLLRFLITTAEHQLFKVKDADNNLLTGALKGWDSFVFGFKDLVEKNPKDVKTIYECIKAVIKVPEDLARYEIPRTGLQIVIDHISLFSSYLLGDYMEIYTYLQILCTHKNKELSRLAYRALEEFLKEMANVLESQTGEEKETNCFWFFMTKFTEILQGSKTEMKDLSVAIRGYGYFAAPCRKYVQEVELENLLGELLKKSSLFYSDANDDLDMTLTHIPSFILAYAHIARQYNVPPPALMSIIEHTVMTMLIHFPRMSNWAKQSSVKSFQECLFVLFEKGSGVLKGFLVGIVYQALVLTCSDALKVDTDYRERTPEEANNLADHTYVEFFSFWKSLFNDTTPFMKLLENAISSSIKNEFFSVIYDEIMTAVIRLANGLNLAAKDIIEDEHSELNTWTSKVTTGGVRSAVSSTGNIATLQPLNLKDHILFQNLVDFWQLFLPKIQPQLFSRWIYLIGDGLIELSTKYPLVSGIYKMMATVLQVCEYIKFFKDVRNWNLEENDKSLEGQVSKNASPLQRSCYLLFVKYLREVYARLDQYKDDLLASCLRLVLSAPRELTLIHELIVPMRLSLKLGLSYYPLATVALDAMDRWITNLSSAENQQWTVNILPALNDYLMVDIEYESESFIGSMAGSSVTAKTRSLLKKNKRWAANENSSGFAPENEIGLRDLQVRILRLLGKLGGENKAILDEPSSENTNSEELGNIDSTARSSARDQLLAWDPEKRLKFKVPFPEVKIEIILDEFLPRICELAEFSVDRKTKVSACELLHALVLLMIGNSAVRIHDSKGPAKSPYHRLYLRVFPVLLKLAVDIDQVPRSLFRPLNDQLIHWLTNNATYENPETIALLNTCIDAVCDPAGPLRDYGADCLAEFVKWSIKQTSTKTQETNPMNMKSLLKRIYTLASHANSAKRLGSSLAVNRIYRIFREEESLVDQFSFELLYWILFSLRLAEGDHEAIGTRQQALQAIQHLQRIIVVKAQLFLKETKNRRSFSGLAKADLAGLVEWLFMETGKVEINYSRVCKELFSDFVKLLPEHQHASSWLNWKLVGDSSLLVNLYETPRLDYRVHEYQTSTSLQFTSWLEQFLCALEGYTWLISNKIASADALLMDNRSLLLDCINYFMNTKSLENLEGMELDTLESEILTPMEKNVLLRKKGFAIDRIITFLKVSLSSGNNNDNGNDNLIAYLVNTSLFSFTFFKLLGFCLFQPDILGLDVMQLEDTNSKLSMRLEVLLKLLSSSTDRSVISTMGKALGEVAFMPEVDLLSLRRDDGSNPTQAASAICGFKMLQITNVMPLIFEFTGSSSSAYQSQPAYMDALFDKTLLLRDVQEPVWIQLIGSMLELALEDENVITRFFAQGLGIPSSISKESYTNATAFYRKFERNINNYMSQHFKVIESKLIANIHEQIVIDLIVGTLEFLLTQRDKKLQITYFLRDLTSNEQFLRILCETLGAENRNILLKIFKYIFDLDRHLLRNTSPMQSEILCNTFVEFMARSVPLNFKNDAMDLLPVFLVFDGPHVEKIEQGLKEMVAYQFPTSSKEYSKDTVQFNEFITSLEKLMRAMVNTTSIQVFKVLVGAIVRESDHVYAEQIHLCIAEFAKKLTLSKFIEVADICFNYYADKSHGFPMRRNVVDQIIIPALLLVPHIYVITFFKTHILEIMNQLKRPPLRHGTVEEVIEDLVDRICSFNFVKILYERLPADELNTSKSQVNAVFCNGGSCKGNELTLAIVKIGHDAKSKKASKEEPDIMKVRLEFYRAAYNAIAAVIICTQTKPEFYRGFLFAENESKNEILWENIVDIQEKLNFKIELERPLMKSRLENFRLKSRLHLETSQRSRPLKYLSSKYLADSSISQSLGTFSSNPLVIESVESSDKDENSMEIDDQGGPSMPASQEPSGSMTLELDVFNSNECMPILLRIIAKLHTQITMPSNSNNSMPAWMNDLHKKFSSRNTSIHVQLFLAKIIINYPEAFENYSTFWIRPLIQLIMQSTEYGEPMNYFVQDLCVVVVTWSKTVKLDDSYEDKTLLFNLMQYLMKNAHHSNRQILRNNLEIIKEIFESWNENIIVPSTVIFENFSRSSKNNKDNTTGIQLLGIVLANNFPPYNNDSPEPHRVPEKQFFHALTDNFFNKYREVYASAAEVSGWALHHMRDNHNPGYQEFEVMIADKLSSIGISQETAKTEPERFLTILHKVQLHEDSLSDSYINQILFLLPKLVDQFKVYALEIIAGCAGRIPNLFEALQAKDFLGLLRHRDELAQLAIMKILHTILKDLTQAQIDYIFDVMVETFHAHSNIDCRTSFYRFLISLMNISSDTVMKDKVKGHLLRGLVDKTESIRNFIKEFWEDKSRLSSETFERLKDIMINFYSPETEDIFLYYATDILLDSLKSSYDYDKPIFEEPLPNAKFDQDLSINTSWQRNTAMTPLFVNTQNALNNPDNADQNEGELRATQMNLAFSVTQGDRYLGAVSSQFGTANAVSSTLFFAPSFSSQGSIQTAWDWNDVDSNAPRKQRKKESETRYDRLRRRFIKSETPSIDYFRLQNEKLKKRIEKAKSLQQQARANKVSILRNYRSGELPDIQIKYMEVIGPLQALSQRDVELSRMLFTKLFTSLIKGVVHSTRMTEETATEYKNTLVMLVQSILSQSSTFFPPFIGSFLRICYDIDDALIDPLVIAKVSESSSNELTGICLLEKKIHYTVPDEPSTKRSRKSGPSQGPSSKRSWVQLARLYKSIDDMDIFRSIYQHKVASTEFTKDAINALVLGDYATASDIFSDAIENQQADVEDTEVQVWEQERLQCFQKLAQWEILAEHVILDVEENTERLWNSDWQDPYLQYFIHSHLKLLDGKHNEENLFIKWDKSHQNPLFKFIDISLRNPERSSILESQFAKELALASIINHDNDRARYYVGRAYSNFVSTWSSLHPLAQSSRLGNLSSLQQIVEMEEYLDLLKRPDLAEKIPDIIRSWTNRYPLKGLDSTDVWDDVIFDRNLFLDRLKDFIQSSEIENLVNGMHVRDVTEIASAARSQRNFKVANDSLKKFRQLVGNKNVDFRYSALKMKFEMAKCTSNQARRLGALLDMIPNFVQMRDAVASTEHKKRIKIMVLEGLTFESVTFEILKDEGTYSVMAENKYFEQAFDSSELYNRSKLVTYCNQRAFKAYEEAFRQTQSGSPSDYSQGKVRLQFARYADKVLRTCDNNQENIVQIDMKEYACIIIEHILSAMNSGVMAACQDFPRLLQLIDTYPETRALFSQHVNSFGAIWMFLRWLPQIVAILDKDGATTIQPVIEKIAVEYPHALYFPLIISSDHYNFSDDATGKQNKTMVEKIKQLIRSPIYEDLILELQRLTDVDHIVKDFMEHILDILKKPRPSRSEIMNAYKEFSMLVLEPDNSRLGSVANTFAEKHATKFHEMCGENGSKLAGMTTKEFETKVIKYVKLIPGGKGPVGAFQLKSYSPWLADYRASNQDEEIEIPGQYMGLSKPHPRSHVKISSFHETILVLDSLRRPKRITIIGTDEKEYMFLVKSGEDIRQDQRVQQVFSVMNDVMKKSSYCLEHKVFIHTYKVVPMTGNLGLIEWVDNSRPLRTCVGSDETSRKSITKAQQNYQAWITKNGGYQNISRVTREDTIKHFNGVISTIDDNLLKSFVYKLTSSPEAFLSIRAQFVSSLAATSICGYLLGIGDRHLENLMIDLTNGRLIAIDFGHAFGSATELLGVPELVPFRLTKQFTGFLEPLGVSGLLEHPMINALDVLQTNKDIILNTMDIFVKEPLLNWTVNATRLAKNQKKLQDQDTFEVSSASQGTSEWYPQQKLDIARRKFDGENPAYILCQELANGHRNKPWFRPVENIAKGHPKENVRAKVGQACSNVQEQVSCLIDLATDPNVLGRMWAGWMSWV